MERHLHRPHADGIAIGELNRPRYALAAEERTVLADERLEHGTFRRDDEPRVPPGHR